jgi:hypothetical protein
MKCVFNFEEEVGGKKIVCDKLLQVLLTTIFTPIFKYP